MIENVLQKLGRRYRQLKRIWREGGTQSLLDRMRRAAAARIAPPKSPLPVRLDDVLMADLTTQKVWTTRSSTNDELLIVNWVITPPGVGSGGHTTMFRLIEHLERAGHRCRVYIYDVYGSDADYFRALVKALFPRFEGTVDDVAAGMSDAHAVVATSWPTAYPVYNDACHGKRFYFVQDFEPWFYPVGSHSALAENTYCMGFHALTAGRFLADKLRADYGMTADAFAFGCDTAKYHILDHAQMRDGIVFYAKPDTPRRAFELGVMALQLFAERHPNLIIHFYGNPISHDLPFCYVNHGVLAPEDLNRLYNRCFAGLSLSMTNVSLVPHEMLSAGCIPVVNDAAQNVIVLDNSFVRYVPSTPHGLASALDEIVGIEHFGELSASASRSVSSMSWLQAGEVVERAIRTAVASHPNSLAPALRDLTYRPWRPGAL
jgi:O-antigen biosynthesis protein